LVCKNRELSVMKTPNAETPMTAGFTPLLTCGVGTCILHRLPE
jgi:superoxide dismutase